MAARASLEQPLGSLSFSWVVTTCQLCPEGWCLWWSPLCPHRPGGRAAGTEGCREQFAFLAPLPSGRFQGPWSLSQTSPPADGMCASPESEKLSAGWSLSLRKRHTFNSLNGNVNLNLCGAHLRAHLPLGEHFPCHCCQLLGAWE